MILQYNNYYNIIVVADGMARVSIGLDSGTTSPDERLITTEQSIYKLQYYIIILILLNDTHGRTVHGLRSVRAVISYSVVIVTVYNVPIYISCNTK